MSTGRTIWRAKDCAWWRREWITALGKEFGSAGPAIIDWLECEAKAQNDGGLVKSGPTAVAHGCFVELVTVGPVLSRAVALGQLEDYEESQGRFTCRISGWRDDQERASAATRKANQRSRQSEDTGDFSSTVPVGHAESRSVPESHVNRTEQNRTGVKTPLPPFPEDFPPELLPHCRAVYRILSQLAERHGGKAVVPLSLAQVVMARRHKPLVRAAHDFAAWSDGKAQRRKDVVSGYRNWLDRTDDLAAIENLDADGSPAAVPGNVVPLTRPSVIADLVREFNPTPSPPTFVESTVIEESA